MVSFPSESRDETKAAFPRLPYSSALPTAEILLVEASLQEVGRFCLIGWTPGKGHVMCALTKADIPLWPHAAVGCGLLTLESKFSSCLFRI